MDVVYRVRRSPTNESLRFSLRSLANLPHDRVWIVGHRPGWARTEHIPCPQTGNRWINSAALLRAACERDEVSESFVLVDDDFFVVELVPGVPALHRGPIREAWGRSTDMPYRRAMRRAEEILRCRWEVPEPLSYELHVPMVIDRAGMLDALAHEVPPGQARTMYGNLAGVGGERAEDVKVYGRTAGLPAGPFASTSSVSFHRTAKAGAAIRAMFLDPGPYEEGPC